MEEKWTRGIVTKGKWLRGYDKFEKSIFCKSRSVNVWQYKSTIPNKIGRKTKYFVKDKQTWKRSLKNVRSHFTKASTPFWLSGCGPCSWNTHYHVIGSTLFQWPFSTFLLLATTRPLNGPSPYMAVGLLDLGDAVSIDHWVDCWVSMGQQDTCRIYHSACVSLYFTH